MEFLKRLSIAVCVLCCAVAPAGVAGAGAIIDLTYTYDASTVYWPTAKPFSLVSNFRGMTEKGYWYASNEYSASEHGGTHADAPLHFSSGGRTIDQVPLEEWIGPAVVINVAGKCEANRDYQLSTDDIAAWEKRWGRIPEGAWVIMYTGLDTKYYPDKKKILGTDVQGPSAVPLLSFPGFSSESVSFLVMQRNIRGIGLDTPSIDFGKSQDFKVHRIICGANKLALENIASLDRVPESGAVLYAMPMLIKGGTGAPARVFAVLP